MKTLTFRTFTGTMLAKIESKLNFDFIYKNESFKLLNSTNNLGVKADLFLAKNNEQFDITSSIYSLIDSILDGDSGASIQTWNILDQGLMQDSLFITVSEKNMKIFSIKPNENLKNNRYIR